jgi:hypothetical protein
MLYIPYPDGWVGFLVYVLKTYYDCKETDLKVLEEFERDYQPNKAIWWYTRETILYRLLNKGLRVKETLQLSWGWGGVTQLKAKS